MERNHLPHTTELLSAAESGQRLRLHSKVQPSVKVLQELRVAQDGSVSAVELMDFADELVDLEWFEPCIHLHGSRFDDARQTAA